MNKYYNQPQRAWEILIGLCCLNRFSCNRYIKLYDNSDLGMVRLWLELLLPVLKHFGLILYLKCILSDYNLYRTLNTNILLEVRKSAPPLLPSIL